jgi:hypothetical protein
MNLMNIDPRKYQWDEDSKYVHTMGKRHGFTDGYSLTVEPERCEGSVFELGAHVIVRDGDNIEADFHLDALGMQLLATSLQEVMIEQTAARMVD